MSKSILVPVGILGHVPLMTALREEFQAPVVAISLTQGVDRMLASLAQNPAERTYSFPAFVRRRKPDLEAMSDAQVRTLLSKLEQDFDIASLFYLANMDRYFLEEKQYSRAIRHIVLFSEFVQFVLEREDPLFVRSNMTTLFGFIWQKACVRRGVPVLKHQASRLSGRFEFSDELALCRIRGWRQSYQQAKAGGAGISDDVRHAAAAWLENFRRNPVRPAYAIRNSVAKFDLSRLARSLKEAVGVRFTREYWRSVTDCDIDLEFHFREPFGRVFFKEVVAHEFRAALHRMRDKSIKDVDLSAPFIYFPLQFTPEITTLACAPIYEDQAYLAREIAKQLPDGMLLYVKEHTSMVGRREGSFYKRLQNVHNIKLVPTRVSTFELMRKARAVATITSTAGWEAYLMGRPVVVFGNVFFDECANVLKTHVHEGMGREIKQYIDGFAEDEKDIMAALQAYFNVTYEGKTGDVGVDTGKGEAPEVAANLARAFRDQIERFAPVG